MIGGQAQVRLEISATALPTNRFRINALPSLVVSVPLPAGVTLASASNPQWSCTPQGTCTISSVASGDTTAAVLKLAIAPTAQSPIIFAPTITVPANADVLALPIEIIAETVPGLMSQEFARGSVTAIGNTVLDCSKECSFVGADPDSATINSSTADLTLVGTVAKAVLVWSSDTSKAPDKVKFITPNGVLDLVADGVVKGYASRYVGAYVGYKDVTKEVMTTGTYGVANLQASLAGYGGWSLIVVTHDDTQPERSLIVALPLSYVTEKTPASIKLPKASSSSSADARVVVSAFEGDEEPGGDTVKLNGVDLTGRNAFCGRIFAVPRKPQLERNNQVDVLDAKATDVGAGDVTLDFATTDDWVMIAAVGIAVDLS